MGVDFYGWRKPGICCQPACQCCPLCPSSLWLKLPEGDICQARASCRKWGGRPHSSLVRGEFFMSRTRRVGGLDAEKLGKRNISQQECQRIALLRNLSSVLCRAPGCPGRPGQTRPLSWLAFSLPALTLLSTWMTFTYCSGSAQLSLPSSWARCPSPCSFNAP